MNVNELFEKVRFKLISPDEFLVVIRGMATGQRRTGLSLGDETTIYRARVFPSNIRPALLSELSYPPYDLTILQRANAKGEQIFYGSFGFKTALVECRVKVNDYVVISEWVNLDEMILMQIGLSVDRRPLEGINKLLHDIFTSEGDDLYEYSSKVAFHFLRGDSISGIIYPSVSSEFESHNVALHTDFVDKKMKFNQAYLLHVTEIANSEDFEVIEIAYASTVDNGRLIWENGRTNKLYF